MLEENSLCIPDRKFCGDIQVRVKFDNSILIFGMDTSEDLLVIGMFVSFESTHLCSSSFAAEHVNYAILNKRSIQSLSSNKVFIRISLSPLIFKSLYEITHYPQSFFKYPILLNLILNLFLVCL